MITLHLESSGKTECFVDCYSRQKLVKTILYYHQIFEFVSYACYQEDRDNMRYYMSNYRLDFFRSRYVRNFTNESSMVVTDNDEMLYSKFVFCSDFPKVIELKY